MSDLRNRGQYAPPVQEEFEYLSDRLASLEATINEEGDLAAVSPINFIHYGDVAINNGNSSGTSTLPQAVNVDKTMLINLGTRNGGGTDSTSCQITLSTSLLVTGSRSGTSGDANVTYCLVEYV